MIETVRPVKLAVGALGGQGGGVVADWLIETARRAGYLAQATSVPGVAQRTGATIYYLEFFPLKALPADGRKPVLALMPHPGDVDIVVASELMEAGRSLQRGIITPDRTTLIVSSHRVYAIGEKTHLGDGRADSERVAEAVRRSSKRFISFDMQAMAEAHGSVISAVMLGALAGSNALPFARDSFREAIRAGGIAVKESLAAFESAASTAEAAGAAGTAGDARIDRQTASSVDAQGSSKRQPLPSAIAGRIERELPAASRRIAQEGTRRLIDYQDIPYAETYLERLATLGSQERNADGVAALTETVARTLALWMSFEDTIRVADLKIREARKRRVLAEVRARPGELVYITEFMKPRVEEIFGTLPVSLGRRLSASKSASRFVGRFTAGKKISTSRIGGFLLLYVLAGLRRWRRGTLRYAQEDARIAEWLALICEAAARDNDLAIEIAECQTLVKGYGETHERGSRHFALVTSEARRLIGAPDAARRVRELRTAALADEQGIALAQALRKVA